ncbi:hypothetical protein [Streptomyces sp. NBRC 110611]|uniref:hypothetical protein n=1 Tax=Streptomyces sp. NBRC 110611 TaxID=1621259 RepID=UPI0008329F86|nr:hypothetical protein [Streptomyces sp. NBRC 110611]
MSTTRESEPAAEPQATSPAAPPAAQAVEAVPASPGDAECGAEGGKVVAPARPASASAARLIFDDPLSQRSSDDTDRGWGERPAGGDSAGDLARFLDEKPPHHL